MNSVEQLINLIPKLEAVEFMGLARVLKVKLIEEKDMSAEKMEDKYQPREFTDVFSDMLANYNDLNRARKREILRLVKKAATKTKVKKNAGNSEDTEDIDGD